MTADAKPVARFDCTNGGQPWCQGCYTMTEADDGDYVLAADYDALRVEVARLQREFDAVDGMLRDGAARFAEFRQRAEAQAAADRKDAERYRHLRSNESNGDVDLCVVRCDWSKQGNIPARYEVIAEDRADQAIDAALARAGKGE